MPQCPDHNLPPPSAENIGEHLRPIPVAILEGVDLVVCNEDTTTRLDAGAGLRMLKGRPHLLCHSAFVANRLGIVARGSLSDMRDARGQPHLDLAELFAFARPAQFALPTPTGLARVLGLHPGTGDGLAGEDPGGLHRAIATRLLCDLADESRLAPSALGELLQFLFHANWPWAPLIRAILEPMKSGRRAAVNAQPFATGLNVWDRLPEWEDEPPRGPGESLPIAVREAQAELDRLLGDDAEARPTQRDYCAKATTAFAPRDGEGDNHILLAEAGTGLGKTLGYLAPAGLWARRNRATVWISTFTKNLQRQLSQEAQRLYSNPAERRTKVVIRKGRENYLCLLNLKDRIGTLSSGHSRDGLLAALIVRWAGATRDGDMVGGDFPAWLMSLFTDTGREARAVSPSALGLTDRRGECVYSACPYYRKCFIERAVRATRRADIVIANHALVMVQAALDHALGAPKEEGEQTSAGAIRRLILDEGHHVFDAADSAFSAHLTGLEAAELRRWLRGGETRSRRGRPLAERIGDLLSEAADDVSRTLLDKVVSAAIALPGPGWQPRVQAGIAEGPAETFFVAVRGQVRARADKRGQYALETACRPLVDGVAEAADALAAALQDLAAPMRALARALMARLDDEARTLETSERNRLESAARGLRRRAELMLESWLDMLDRLSADQPEGFVEWFAIEQQFGREVDVGLHRHWIDPSVPLARIVLEPLDGAIITSATLKDRPPDTPDDWTSAEMRTGVSHLPYAVTRSTHASPFDYPAQARILVVKDVNRDDPDQIAAAYRELFLAAHGGALGLFTAIARLKETYRRIAEPLARSGLPLFAQHVDPVDTGTLVDLFRAERDACLLGTDALRDGVDVPGEALRLIVLERVPWPQPTILERARREAFGPNTYQDMIVRLRLRQAFGRLIRREGDRGVFVILDARLPSRFTTAFPAGVDVRRTGLVDAIETVEAMLGKTSRAV